MVCAAVDGMADDPGGEVGVPEAVAPEADLSFADGEGTGSQACPGFGCEGSRGGARSTCLGMEAAGCEFNTSFCAQCQRRYGGDLILSILTQLALESRNLQKTPSSRTSFIRRHRFRKTASIRLRSSMMPRSSLALVGLAA